MLLFALIAAAAAAADDVSTSCQGGKCTTQAAGDIPVLETTGGFAMIQQQTERSSAPQTLMHEDAEKADAEVQSFSMAGLVEKANRLRQDPNVQKGQAATSGSVVPQIICQLLFGLVYYFIVVSKYPKLEGLKPNEEAIAMQELGVLAATQKASTPNCVYSFCFEPARAAHTFHAAGVMNYWPGCILMSMFPCCTLWAVNSFTDLRPKLGGEKKSMLEGAVFALCCGCCVVAQDAESLDLITGVESGWCGVKSADTSS